MSDNLTPLEKGRLATTMDLNEVTDIALRELERMGGDVIEVCGPISTGGLGTIDRNIAVFHAVITRLREQGHKVFDLTPYEIPIKKIRDDLEKRLGWTKEQSEDYILWRFYNTIFESPFIKALYFIPTWEGSRGAKWEHEQARRIPLPIVYLSFEELGIDYSKF